MHWHPARCVYMPRHLLTPENGAMPPWPCKGQKQIWKKEINESSWCSVKYTATKRPACQTQARCRAFGASCSTLEKAAWALCFINKKRGWGDSCSHFSNRKQTFGKCKYWLLSGKAYFLWMGSLLQEDMLLMRTEQNCVCLCAGLSWCGCAGSTTLKCVPRSWRSSAAWRTSWSRRSERSVSTTAPTTSQLKSRSSTWTSSTQRRTRLRTSLPRHCKPPNRPLRPQAQRPHPPRHWPPAPPPLLARQALSWTNSPPASRQPMGSRGRAFHPGRGSGLARAPQFGLRWTNCRHTHTWMEDAKTSVPCLSRSRQPADLTDTNCKPSTYCLEEPDVSVGRILIISSFFIKMQQNLLDHIDVATWWQAKSLMRVEKPINESMFCCISTHFCFFRHISLVSVFYQLAVRCDTAPAAEWEDQK